ncbi:hypothetical protein CSA37_06385 [Candidatus Fermentibacteria bacterium]|nr:MAG: hypothetical protein CSA37_06385 [Candidatus Fermentibacteria bacterium]
MAATSGGRRALALLKNPGRLLTSILLGNTFVNVAASSVAAGIVAELIPGPLGMGAGVLVMTFLLLVLGEISPKSIARRRNRAWIEASAPVMTVMLKVFGPAADLLKYPAEVADRFVPGRNDPDNYRERELNILMEIARDEGFLGGEADMASAILELDQRACATAMIPREKVVSFTSDLSISEMTEKAFQSKHSAYPLVDKDNGMMSGVVDMRDLLGAGEFRVREVPFFPESARLSTVLDGLRKAGGGIGAVVDEYGDWSGVITVSDVLSRALFAGMPGSPLPEGVSRSDGGFTVPAWLSLDLLSVLLEDQKLTAKYAESCGGLLQEVTGKLPVQGDEITYMGYQFRVIEMNGRTPSRILVRREVS